MNNPEKTLASGVAPSAVLNDQIAAKLRGEPVGLFLSELFQGGGQLALMLLLLELVTEWSRAWSRPDIWVLLVVAVGQSAWLARLTFKGREAAWWSRLLGLVVYAVVESVLEGPHFFLAPHHISFAVLSLVYALGMHMQSPRRLGVAVWGTVLARMAPALAEAQTLLTDRSREKAVEEAKKYLYQVNQLIASGRLPKNEAEQPALFVETLQSQKEESNQQLAFHYLQLMRAMGVVEEHVIQKKAIEQREENITQEIEQLLLKYTKKYNQEIKEAYPPVDKQEKLFEYQFKLIEQNKVLAKDETKWNMNIAGYANIWEKEKQYGVNVSLDFPINDKLKRYQSVYHLQVEQHNLKTHQQLHRYYFPKELIFKRQEVESKFKQLALGTKRKELAAKSLNTAELKWQAGRITMFEVIHLATQLQETNLGILSKR